MHVEMQSRYQDTPRTRLFQWFGLSLFFHVALVTFVGGAQQVLPHRPLVVDIQHIPPEAAGPLTNAGMVPELDIENPLPQAPAPEASREIARPPEPPKPAVDLPVPFESYLNVNDVDIRAEPANDVPLSYPAAAYVRKIHGIVRLHLFINEQGRLDRIDLVDATPKGIFEQDAIETVSQLYFHPATRYGRPVKSQKTIEVVFDPRPDPVKPSAITPNASATGK